MSKTIAPLALVFKGGSVKNLSYTGVIRYLQENNMLANVKILAGTSGGAVTCMMIALGYTGEEMLDDFANTDVDTIFGGNVGSIKSLPKIVYNSWRQYGMVDGTGIDKKLMEIIAKKIPSNPKITLKDFYNSTGKTIICVTACLNTHKAEYLSHLTVPDMPLYLAIRLSMNLPPVFPPVIIRVLRKGIKFVKENDDSYINIPDGVELGVKNITETGEEVSEAWFIDTDLVPVCKFSKPTDLLPEIVEFEKWYVDGGLIDNYPITYVENLLKNEVTSPLQILGFDVDSSEPNNYYTINKKWPWDYFKNMLYAQFTELDRRTRECCVSTNLSTTIPINTSGIDFYEFKLTTSQLQQLYNDGYKSIKSFFNQSTVSNENEVDSICFNINYI
jgi:predicted acylesterase/phospholipase RssA